MKKTSLFIVLLLALAACEKKVETEYRDVPVLRASSVYRLDSVYYYLKKYKDANKELAESYLKRSREAESNDIAMAVYYCKRAITLYPVMEYYKTLAALVEKTGDYSESHRLYYNLVNKTYIKDDTHPEGEYINVLGEPDEDLYYEFMVSVMRVNGYLYGEIIYEARDKGFDVTKLKDRLFADKRLKIDMTTPDAKNMMLMFLSEDELAAYNKLESTFKEMLSSIKNVSPVFEINKENVSDFNYEDFNGRGDYEEMDAPTNTSYVFVNYLQEKREKPDGWFSYNYNHVIDINDSVKAVVYAVDSSETACPVEMRHIYHRLVIYNKNAEIISSQIVAMQSGEQLMTMNFNTNKFSVVEYKRTWKNQYDKHDFDNYITGIEKVKESSFVILPDGDIREQESYAAPAL